MLFFNIALKYEYGNPIERNRVKAREFFEKAAAAENNSQGLFSRYLIAFNYYYSFEKSYYGSTISGINDKDEINRGRKKAVEIFEALANEGLGIAQYEIGLAFMRGIEIPFDRIKALEWLTKAALQGISNAQAALGYYYDEKGIAEQTDLQLALQWYQKAAEQNSADAQLKLAYLYRSTGNTEKEAEDYFLRSASGGNYYAKSQLARIYIDRFKSTNKTQRNSENPLLKIFKTHLDITSYPDEIRHETWQIMRNLIDDDNKNDKIPFLHGVKAILGIEKIRDPQFGEAYNLVSNLNPEYLTPDENFEIGVYLYTRKKYESLPLKSTVHNSYKLEDVDTDHANAYRFLRLAALHNHIEAKRFLIHLTLSREKQAQGLDISSYMLKDIRFPEKFSQFIKEFKVPSSIYKFRELEKHSLFPEKSTNILLQKTQDEYISSLLDKILPVFNNIPFSLYYDETSKMKNIDYLSELNYLLTGHRNLETELNAAYLEKIVLELDNVILLLQDKLGDNKTPFQKNIISPLEEIHSMLIKEIKDIKKAEEKLQELKNEIMNIIELLIKIFKSEKEFLGDEKEWHLHKKKLGFIFELEPLCDKEILLEKLNDSLANHFSIIMNHLSKLSNHASKMMESYKKNEINFKNEDLVTNTLSKIIVFNKQFLQKKESQDPKAEDIKQFKK